MEYRSIYNGTLRVKDVGKHVKVVGWVSKKRNLGSLVFIDLRDKTGIIQVIIASEEIEVPDIRNEYVIQVEGVVTKKDVANPLLATGEVEIKGEKVVVLSRAKTPPLIIAETTDALEEVRLKYRYLDLRRPNMQKHMRTRAAITKATREYLDNLDFLEIETPILTKSTPGGARDFLVPSRLHKGSFYALPQSPQTYKQLLMIAGFERYYQIARCFRDEDLRADRQPDFTQIDIETSFLTMDEFLDIMEGLLHHIFKKVASYEVKLPLRRLSYKDAMENYGSDKPDTRFELKIRDIKFVLASSSANLFKDHAFINTIVVPGVAKATSRKALDELNLISQKYNIRSVGNLKFNDGDFNGSLAKLLTEKEKSDLVKLLNLKEDDLLIVAFSNVKRDVLTALGAIRLHFAKQLNLIEPGTFDLLWVYRFPLFSKDSVTGKFVSEHHQFTMPLDEHLHLLDTEPEKVLSQAYDIVINGNEAGGGSMRIYDQDLQAKIFNILGMSEEEIANTFGYFIEALKYGTPPHGGIAFGLDRLTMIISGTDNIRDVISFPKNVAAVCPMSEEPGPVSKEQLDELHIKIKE